MTPIPIYSRVSTPYGIGRYQGTDDNCDHVVMINRADWKPGMEYPRPFTDKSPTVTVRVKEIERA